MTLLAKDVAALFERQGTWVDWTHSVDAFKAGAPDAPVTGIAVGWQSLQAALEEAYDLGCNLFITHEPTFYDHWDCSPEALDTPAAQAKRAWLERTGMVVYRCHDVWDRYPGIGIVDAWADYLGFGPALAADDYHRVLAVPCVTAWELVMMVLERVRPLGEQAVLFSGRKDRMVSRVGIGTGAITDVRAMLALGADAILATDDGTSQWRDGAYCADASVPLLVVNHAVAEIPGMRAMARYLQAQFPDTPVYDVGRTCTFELMATEHSNEQQLRMLRPTLGDLPPVELPAGYTLRSMRADELWAYLEVMNQSCFNGRADEAWFRSAFSSPLYDPSFIQIIWKGERPVAAVGAWQGKDPTMGVLHWLGVRRDERGAGLGKAITLAGLHRLRERGFQQAMLHTQSWRKQAIAAYLAMGFQPHVDEMATAEDWQRTLDELAVWRAANGK